MIKHIKKTPKRVQPLGVKKNYFKNILYTYSKSKWRFWQWL